MAASAIAGLRLSVPGLPVLLYHGIGTGDPAARDKYRLAASSFRAQLELLRSQHYCTLPPQAIADPLDSMRSERAVVITFDDGLESDYRAAFPLLAENGFTAAFFVNTAEIGKPGRLGWPEMREMQQAGMSFQSHGHHHVDYSRLAPRFAVAQLRLSREKLEQNLGHGVDCFSAPYGLLNRHLIAAAHEAGFPFIFSSRNWPVRPGHASAGRFAIYQNTALGEFRDLVGCAMLPLARRSLREAALLIPKRLALRIRPQWLGVAVFEENP
jgi:peptidoglycan/xylan/chitin deacetylase (PgdA/CDA1 family)